MQADRGFSLVEMLAALMVLSVAGVALVNAVGQTSRSAALARDKAVAQVAASNILNQLIIDAAGRPVAEDDGVYEVAGRSFDWSLEVEATADPGLSRLTLELLDAETGAFAHELITFERREG